MDKCFLVLIPTLILSIVAFSQNQDSTNSSGEDQIFEIVEQMPIFGECDTNLNHKKLNDCSNLNLLMYITNNLIYPEEAKERGAQGTAKILFSVDENGKVCEIELINAIEGEEQLNNEAMRLVQSFPHFKPAIQRGKPVKVKMNIPIRFIIR